MSGLSKTVSKTADRTKSRPARAAAATIKPASRSAHGTASTKRAGKPANGKSAAPKTAAKPIIASKPARPPRDYSIAAVARTLDLLEALASIGPAPLATVADAAGCTRTAGFRLLRTLQSRGFAIQDEARGVWRLGARWTALGQAAETQGALAATAMPFMNELAKLCGENVYLHVRDGQAGETMAIMQADPGLRVYTEVGKRRPLHAGPFRLLLAHAPEAVQTQVLAQKLPRFTPATRTDPAWIAADLQRIRARGYLITADEVVPGAVSVTVPVRDASGAVVAALCISAASLRMRAPRPRALVPMVAEAAAKLSRGLGRRDTPSDAVTSPHTTTLQSSADMQNAGLQVTTPRPNGHGNGHALPHPATHLALT
jgi:DNA-binding IclR family transcriptional regulator